MAAENEERARGPVLTPPRIPTLTLRLTEAEAAILTNALALSLGFHSAGPIHDEAAYSRLLSKVDAVARTPIGESHA